MFDALREMWNATDSPQKSFPHRHTRATIVQYTLNSRHRRFPEAFVLSCLNRTYVHASH